MGPARDAVPRLENGDHLRQPEFHRRYEACPEIKKAELVEGVVYIQGRVSARDHGEPHGQVNAWLGMYHATHPGCFGAVNTTVILDADNEVQPDVILYVKGGSCATDEEGYIHGPPELVAEIAASSASYDLHVKKHVYRRSGVQEYVVWRVLDRALDWFVLEEGEYRALAPGADGLLESRRFPGLRLDVPALLAGDLAAVLRALE